MSNEAKIVISAQDKTAAAFASASSRLEQLTSQAGDVVGRLAGIGSALTAVAGAFELRGAIEALDRMDEMSEKTGIATERLSELRYASEAAGTPFDSLNRGMQKLSKAAVEAASGNKQMAETFERMNIQLKNSDGTMRSIDDLLLEVADRFSGYEEGVEKSALAQELFGKTGQDMIPILNKGRIGIESLTKEAKQMGAVLTGDAAKAAAEFADNQAKIGIAWEAIKADTMTPLIKVLAGVSTAFIDAKRQGEGFFSWFTRVGIMNDFTLLFGGKGAQPITTEQIQARVNALGGSGAGGGRGFVNPKVVAPTAASSESTDTNKKPSGGAPKDPLADAKRFLESLEKQLEVTKGLTVEERALSEIQLGRLGKVTPELEKQITATARLIDLEKARKSNDDASVKAAEAAAAAAGKMADQAQAFAQEVEKPWESLQRRLSEIDKLAQSNPLIGSDAEAVARQKTKAWSEYLQTLEQVAEQTVRLSDEAYFVAGEIQGALGDGLASALDGDFRGIGDAFGRMIKRMTLQAASAQLNKYLFGDMFTGGSNLGALGSWIGGMFPTAWPSYDMYGGITGAGNSALMSYYGNGVGSFAVGTDFVPRDMLAVVHKGERIIPAHQNTGDAGTTYINLTVGDVASMAQVRRAVEEGVAAAKVQTVSGLNRSRTYGGVMA